MVNTGKAHQYKGMTGPNEKSLETVDVIIQTWLLQNFAEILFHQSNKSTLMYVAFAHPSSLPNRERDVALPIFEGAAADVHRL